MHRIDILLRIDVLWMKETHLLKTWHVPSKIGGAIDVSLTSWSIVGNSLGRRACKETLRMKGREGPFAPFWISPRKCPIMVLRIHGRNLSGRNAWHAAIFNGASNVHEGNLFGGQAEAVKEAQCRGIRLDTRFDAVHEALKKEDGVSRRNHDLPAALQ